MCGSFTVASIVYASFAVALIVYASFSGALCVSFTVAAVVDFTVASIVYACFAVALIVCEFCCSFNYMLKFHVKSLFYGAVICVITRVRIIPGDFFVGLCLCLFLFYTIGWSGRLV